ncbi:asparagine synthase (glutamine-hydrolyzing) [Streptomyces longwoodensis]|uniref:asparagine synthase (glutamine-hydrolyzing) n=1 Tax=Streptomyces longwoodensis TaxID=68231 RepID=UPI002255BFA1|nr:asparagine synthase (glutamine-hydrolyzing) [Streptomyces longwoodensis]MCX5000564.1 asparagine synthase (glutamine-hydrolyzing) [Streptomyces longwoodensis]WTI49255.1 asparagine synthase (glutamine-hydrolyzing) [Streptomyces longwoodensis]WUC75521.1 asparagine synthase (glutamine-hydrolyzing) [Streptomyces longwoodensis]
MCGIAGSVSLGHAPVHAPYASAACAAMAHRGPDETGSFSTPRAALAMCRLKVIGLHDGSQPVFSDDGTVVCVLNGEIYNHQELRAFLAARGRSVRGGSDAQVLPHLYQELGEDFVERLHGMFAVAVYDTRRDRLVLATDRVGKKPLFYAAPADGTVAFASELSALMLHPGISQDVDPVAVDQYLSYRVVPAPHTIYRQVRKLEPATVLVLEAGRPQRRSTYWRFSFSAELDDTPQAELDDRIDALLQQAVQDRLESDVPLGAMLSGGLDSSLVVAMATRQLGRPIHTFSVGFEHAAFDESAHARTVAEHCGTQHHVYRIGAEDAKDAVDTILSHMGEPYAFPSAIAASCMYRLARQHVTVVLTGDGSDEIFCGYGRYRRLRGLPAGTDLADRYERVLVDGVPHAVKDRLYTAGFAARIPGHPHNYLQARFDRTDPSLPDLDRAMQVDSSFWLSDAQLVKIDRMSMAHSVEPRSPLLDHRLIDYVTRIPAARKLVGTQEKVPLKRVAARYLPRHVLERRKQELAVPLESWLGTALRGTITDTLLSEASLERGYFRPDALRSVVREFRPEHSYALWTLFMLERWHRLQEDSTARAAATVAHV